MKGIVAGIAFALTAQVLMGQTGPRAPLGIASDWTHHHLLYPDSKDFRAMAESRRDPRSVQNWYLRHREAWWPERHPVPGKRSRRDWSVPLTAFPSTFGFEPRFDFSFDISPDIGYGSLSTTDIGNGEFLATAGSLSVTGGLEVGTYPLYPGGPGSITSPSGFFFYDSVLYPSTNPRSMSMGFSSSAAVWRSTSGATLPIVIPSIIMQTVSRMWENHSRSTRRRAEARPSPPNLC